MKAIRDAIAFGTFEEFRQRFRAEYHRSLSRRLLTP
jgi:queuine/archaeosine tRNA-ribosyltransferase